MFTKGMQRDPVSLSNHSSVKMVDRYKNWPAKKTARKNFLVAGNSGEGYWYDSDSFRTKRRHGNIITQELQHSPLTEFHTV